MFAICSLLVCLLLTWRVEHAYVAAWAVALIILIGIAWPLLIQRLSRIEVLSSAHALAGDPVSLRLRTHSPLPAPGVELMLASDAIVLITLLPGVRELTVRIPSARRGIYPLDNVVVSADWPFGLWRAALRARGSGRLIAWPRPLRRETYPLETMAQPLSVESAWSHGAGNDEHIGLRAYRQGDSIRTVHWQQTARHDRLIVRERAGASRRVLTLVLDTDASAYESDDHFEQAVSIAAGVIESAIGQAVWTVLVVGQEQVTIRDASAHEAAMDLLAGASRSDHVSPVATHRALVVTSSTAATARPAAGTISVDAPAEEAA